MNFYVPNANYLPNFIVFIVEWAIIIAIIYTKLFISSLTIVIEMIIDDRKCKKKLLRIKSLKLYQNTCPSHFDNNLTTCINYENLKNLLEILSKVHEFNWLDDEMNMILILLLCLVPLNWWWLKKEKKSDIITFWCLTIKFLRLLWI